jgi:formylmethanofuran dehydrogenase subunit E
VFTFYPTGIVRCDLCGERLLNQCDDTDDGVVCDFDTWSIEHGPDICWR